MMRDLGTAAENYFIAWCAAAGITANKSVSDMNGWDVFIEINNDEKKHNLETIHEGIVEAKIQIKATDSVNKWVSVELSNLKKMATTPLPSFYVLMEFDGEATPQRAYLLHIDKTQIAAILERTAKTITKDSDAKLNKKTMRLKFHDEITPLSPSKLKEMISNHIGKSHLSYMDTKRKHLRNAGYEDGTHRIQFSIKGDEQLRSLIDISLGQKGKVDIEAVHGTTLRFGVTTEHAGLSSDSAVLEMPDVIPDMKGSLTFRDQKTGRSLTFPVDLYRSPFNSWVPEPFRKVRFDAELFELQLLNYGKSMHLTAHTDNLDSFEIERALKLLKLVHMLWQPNSVKITFTFAAVISSITVNPGEGFADCSHQLSIMEKVIKIKNHFELDEDLYVTSSEIDKNHKRIIQTNFLINDQLDLLTLNFGLDKGSNTDTNADCLYVAYLELGNHAFIELFVFNGEITEKGTDKYCLTPKTKTTLYKTVIKKYDITLENLKQELLLAAEEHQPSCLLINLIPFFLSHADFSYKPNPQIGKSHHE
ncbi:DUF4365 domain-containing protein [Pseudomonas sp. P7]|uniref:DUF4365 domain-containing protein n=1 Tax=Pseudomonas sivasensis TaxID=1880678 RepID=UPI0015ECC07E|nr:DUF4365 domain-containing protein [Pseudomonas sivasensis]MBA2926530.1 DUF4365 domain-containing protein [Pseudomonas sivasensis]